MILAAGLGTRLKPWTDHHPKALAQVNGKSLLQHNIEYLQRFGITNVIINVHHFANQIIDALQQHNGFGSKITISNEEDEVLETGGGLMKAAPLLAGTKPFVLMNVDVLTDLDLGLMINTHLLHKPLATLATTHRTTSRYLLFNNKNQLCGWRNKVTGEEKPASGTLINACMNTSERAFSGIHVIDPHIFDLIKQHGKFSMIDVYLDLMNTNPILSYDHSDSLFIDVGKPESITSAEHLFAKREV